MSTNFKLVISKTVKNDKGVNEYQSVGSIEVPIYTLEEFGIDAEVKETKEDGTIVYSSNLHNFIYSALVQRTKDSVKNKLKAGSVELRNEDNKIHSSIEELVTPSVRTFAAAKLYYKEFTTAFKDYLAKNKSETAQRVFGGMIANRAGIAVMPQNVKDKLIATLTEFAASLSAEALEQFQDAIQSVIDACDKSIDDAFDLDDL